ITTTDQTANEFGFVATDEQDDAQEIEEEASKGFKIEKQEAKKKRAILTVITNVINDDGGSAAASDFRMSVSGNDPIPESFPGDEKGVRVSIEQGSFSVFESALDGYTQSFSADCSGTIELYGKKTCTVTNDDVHQYSTSTVVTTGSDPSTESSDTTTDDSYVQPFDDETIVTPGSDTSTESSDTTTDDTTTDDTTYSTASTTMYEEDQSDYKFLKKYIKVSQNSKETFSNLPDSSNSHGSWKLYCVVDGEKVDCTDDDGVSFTLVDTDGDGEYDAAQWNVLEGTTEFYIESEITIINVQSYPTVGGEWVVEFTTQGTADLIIRGIDGTFIGPSDDPSTDLVFSKLSDGQRTIHPIVDGNLIIYRDYSSTFEGSLTNHVITAGEHHLEFTFGNNVQVAHNAAFRVDWRQCANFDGGFTLGDCHWIGSIVQSGNAQYFESMSVPQRLIVEGIPPAPSDQHSLTFSVDTAKKNIHAYDFLTSWNQATLPPNPGVLNNLNECGEEGAKGALVTCNALLPINGGFRVEALVPDALPGVPGTDTSELTSDRTFTYELTFGDRTIEIFGDKAISNQLLTFNGFTTGKSHSTAEYTLSWKSKSTDIMVRMAGHLALSGTGTAASGVSWGQGEGASNISGGSYHFKLGTLDNNSLGSQDNQIKSAAVLVPLTGSIRIIKDTQPNDTQDFSYTTTGGLTPLTFTLDDDSDITNSNIQEFFDIPVGPYTVTESSVTGFDLTAITCIDSSTPSTGDPSTRTATINLDPGETVTCTFENTKRGTIIVEKITDPAGDPATFTFTGDA
ncbi:hypothetical protein LCGC14_1929010, partial [marine sediment metagenome]